MWEDGRTSSSFPCTDQFKVIVQAWPVSALSKVVLEYGVHRGVRDSAGSMVSYSSERCYISTIPLVHFHLRCFWKSYGGYLLLLAQ